MTLSRSGWERSVPSELRATQKYCPLSVYLRRDRWSCGLKLSGRLPLSISAEHIREHKSYRARINFSIKQWLSVCLWHSLRTCALNCWVSPKCWSVPLNHAKLSTGGAASLVQVKVAEPPSDTSPAGKSVMEVERGASTGEEKEIHSKTKKILKKMWL